MLDIFLTSVPLVLAGRNRDLIDHAIARYGNIKYSFRNVESRIRSQVNTMVVNGNTWPYLQVEQRRYRFRFLNGSQSRFLILKLDNGGTF